MYGKHGKGAYRLYSGGATRSDPVAALTTALPASGSFVMRMTYAALPAGAITIRKHGVTYYPGGNTWFQHAYGANGVH